MDTGISPFMDFLERQFMDGKAGNVDITTADSPLLFVIIFTVGFFLIS